MTKTKKKPLDVRYADALEALTPAQAQLAEIASAARVSIHTARAWVAGKQVPTPQAMVLLSEHYNMKETELFTEGHFDKQSAS